MIRIILSLLFLLTVFSISKFIFDPAYLYYELPWLDIPMHVIGGICVAFLVTSLLLYKKIKVSFLYIVVWYMIIAFSWEIYEHILNYMHVKTWYGSRMPLEDIVDSLYDFLNGFIGMSIFYLFMKKK
ncbi:MAG: hypothetical protein KBC41_01840 [Candidatus Pacebacteria bacterium]|nr:hypothetical protein [Candidatus Paceibacterota bacterium]MBP9866800.1 hypothetical protein [Candidatus Paceibacterota bacterium]